jgi:hypothetical protein
LIGSIDGRTRRGNRKVLIVKGSRDLDWRAPSPSPEKSTAYPRNVSPVRRARRLGASFCHQFHRPTSWTGGSIPLGRQAPSERIRRRPVGSHQGPSPHRISTSDWAFVNRRTRGEKHARRSYPPRYAADLSRAKALGATQGCVTPRGHLRLAPSSWNLTDVPASRLVGGCWEASKSPRRPLSTASLTTPGLSLFRQRNPAQFQKFWATR